MGKSRKILVKIRPGNLGLFGALLQPPESLFVFLCFSMFFSWLGLSSVFSFRSSFSVLFFAALQVFAPHCCISGWTFFAQFFFAVAASAVASRMPRPWRRFFRGKAGACSHLSCSDPCSLASFPQTFSVFLFWPSKLGVFRVFFLITSKF